jgi:acyl transferase domain-containing protein
VVLALVNQAIPPHLHLKKLNEHINLDATPLTIPTQLTPWLAGQHPRIAGVSSFGFGGTNAHAILQEAPFVHMSNSEACLERPLHIMTLSAKSEYSLQQLACSYVDYLTNHPDVSIPDMCFTANTGKEHFEHRLAVIGNSAEEFKQKIEKFASPAMVSATHYAHVRTHTKPSVAFLYTGHGSQYFAMGRKLYETQPVFRRALDQCAEILSAQLEVPLLSVLYETSANPLRLGETAYTQPAFFSLEYALTELWKSRGIVPDAVLGHSVGEYAAAYVAGIFSLEDGLQLVAERGRLIQSLPKDGQMLVIFADQEQVSTVLAPYHHLVSIAMGQRLPLSLGDKTLSSTFSKCSIKWRLRQQS